MRTWRTWEAPEKNPGGGPGAHGGGPGAPGGGPGAPGGGPGAHGAWPWSPPFAS